MNSPPSVSDAFYEKDGKQFGPITREELDRLIDRGELGPADRVRVPPSTEWVTVADYSAIARAIPPIIPLPVQSPRPHTSPTLKNMMIIIAVLGVYAAIAVPSLMRARMRATASCVLSANMRQVDAAKDQYMLENSKDKSVTPTWADLTPYLKAGGKLTMDGGNDEMGNPIILGTLGERPRVHPDTKKALKSAVDDGFWGPFS